MHILLGVLGALLFVAGLLVGFLATVVRGTDIQLILAALLVGFGLASMGLGELLWVAARIREALEAIRSNTPK